MPRMAATAATAAKRAIVRGRGRRMLEGRIAREDEVDAFGAARDLNTQRRERRAMEANTDAPVVRQAFEAQVVEAWCDLAGVVEDRHVHPEAIRDPPELALRQQRMAIAEPPAPIP